MAEAFLTTAATATAFAYPIYEDEEPEREEIPMNARNPKSEDDMQAWMRGAPRMARSVAIATAGRDQADCALRIAVAQIEDATMAFNYAKDFLQEPHHVETTEEELKTARTRHERLRTVFNEAETRLRTAVDQEDYRQRMLFSLTMRKPTPTKASTKGGPAPKRQYVPQVTPTRYSFRTHIMPPPRYQTNVMTVRNVEPAEGTAASAEEPTEPSCSRAGTSTMPTGEVRADELAQC